jgi:hypothetical protein
MAGGTVSAEQGIEQPDDKASHEVHHQCAPRKTLRTGMLHSRREEVSQCASHEATQAYDQGGFYHMDLFLLIWVLFLIYLYNHNKDMNFPWNYTFEIRKNPYICSCV